MLSIFIILLFSIGFTWGSAYFYLFPYSKDIREGLVILTLGGMAIGAIPSMAPYMSVYLAFIVPMILPVMLSFFVKFSLDFTIFSGMILVFMFMLIITATHFKALMLRMLRVDKKEHQLIEQLSHSNAQLKLAYEKIKKISRTDSMTGLPNRRFFDEQISQEWARAKREKTELSLLMIDVDNFKIINDEMGHPEGDHYLKTIAEIMQAQIRRPADFLARIGGDEFAAILPNTPFSKALLVAESMRNAIIVFNNTTYANKSLSISIGVSSNTQQDSSDALIKTADRYLYQAKNLGKNQVYSDGN